MKKLNLKKIAFSTLAMGFVLATPATVFGDENVESDNVFAMDALDETEEEDVFFAAGGCGGPGGCGASHSGPARPITPPPSNNTYPNNPNMDDLQNQPYQQNNPQYQQTPTRGGGCGGMVLSQSTTRVDASKRAQLI